jgi:hypothetical protein
MGDSGLKTWQKIKNKRHTAFGEIWILKGPRLTSYKKKKSTKIKEKDGKTRHGKKTSQSNFLSVSIFLFQHLHNTY